MNEVVVIQVPVYLYLTLMIMLSVAWAVWVVKDVLGRGVSKYSVKRRVLGYIGGAVVIAWHWVFLVA